MYLIAYIDRQNVSYAKLQMVGDLGLSETAYGLGASLFFIGYFFFEVLSNVILERVGARIWFARIMATWGLITVLLGFTWNATMFYVLRFLLGAAIGGALLDLDGYLGLRGWQWVFVAFPLAAYGLSYWLPTVVKGFGVSSTVNGLLNIIPWVFVAFALWWSPRHAELHRGSRTLHIVAPMLIGAAGLTLSVLVPGHALKFACLCIVAAGIFAGQSVFWTLPPTFLKGATAGGIAAINSAGNLGGFVAQNVAPMIKDATGSDLAPMLFLAACLVAGAALVFVVQAVLRSYGRGPEAMIESAASAAPG